MAQASVMHQPAPVHDAKERPGGCADIPELARLRYFHGRALGALDLRREQGFHLEKDRLRNRVLHGWGIACGLGVEIVPPDEGQPCDDEPRTLRLRILPGAAIDARGDEIVVRRPRAIVVERLLGEDALARLREEPGDVWISICFHEELIDPTRPVLGGGCDPVPGCEYGRVRETYRILATTTRPDPGPRCEPCCGSGGGCVELVRIPCLKPGAEHGDVTLDPRGRRPLGLHDLAEIAGVNWLHGATYSREDATALFAKGIEVRLTHPVQVASLRPGVVDLTVVEAGGGRAAGTYDLQGEFDGLPTASPLTDRFRFRSTSDESLQYGDRVLIRIRGDFILDECCRALDAEHIGGAVPALPEDELDVRPGATPAPLPCAARTSGDGTEGGTFESWIFVEGRYGAGNDHEHGAASPGGRAR